jgi:putative transposase
MLIRKAYKYRIYPSPAQQVALVVQFGHKRFVYNRFHALRTERYQQTGKGMFFKEMCDLLTEMKGREEWLNKADSQVLQQALMDLNEAYQNFSDKRAGFPHFKHKRSRQMIPNPRNLLRSE